MNKFGAALAWFEAIAEEYDAPDEINTIRKALSLARDMEWGENHFFIEIKDGKIQGKYSAGYYGIKKQSYLEFAKELIAETPFGLKARAALPPTGEKE